MQDYYLENLTRRLLLLGLFRTVLDLNKRMVALNRDDRRYFRSK
jgi:hypothetical protein